MELLALNFLGGGTAMIKLSCWCGLTDRVPSYMDGVCYPEGRRADRTNKRAFN